MERVCYSIKDAYILEIVFFFFVNHNTNTLGNFEEHTHIHKVEEKIYIYQQINQGNLKGTEMGTTYNFCITANHDEGYHRRTNMEKLRLGFNHNGWAQSMQLCKYEWHIHQ